MSERAQREEIFSPEECLRWQARVRSRLGGIALVAGMGAIGYGGGVLAMSAFPAEVAIGDNYRADVTISALPHNFSHIKIQTTLGEVNTDFSSLLPPAPGIEVSPMLTDKIVKTAQDNKFNLNSLIPSDQELQSAVSSAAEQLALRFGIGVIAAEAILLAGASIYRRGYPNARQIASGATAGALAFGAIASQTALNYQPDHYSSFTVNGVLTSAYENRALLSDMQARSEQMNPFVTSLLTISGEIQKTVVSPESDKPAVAKFLLVSDIHGVNQYSMLKKIINDEAITAVIDTGDLVNFGLAAEIDASGIGAGIESLGVPYLFNTGNHDSNSPSSHAVLARLAQIKNVILLQPSADTYNIADINGVTIAGFNDPLYYGSEGNTNDKLQATTTDKFNQTFADEPTPDIVATHEPSAADAVKKAGVIINGHFHQAALKGNHIQVGSFTAGGLFHHSPNSKDGVSTEPPSQFDVLEVNTSCTPQTLKRFSFGSIIDGNPHYDSVAYINGDQLESKPDKDRTCGPDKGISLRTINATNNTKALAPVGVGPTTIPDYLLSPMGATISK